MKGGKFGIFLILPRFFTKTSPSTPLILYICQQLMAEKLLYSLRFCSFTTIQYKLILNTYLFIFVRPYTL
mgnify:CR=1 FL=1